jgi:hypothetical protein
MCISVHADDTTVHRQIVVLIVLRLTPLAYLLVGSIVWGIAHRDSAVLYALCMCMGILLSMLADLYMQLTLLRDVYFVYRTGLLCAAQLLYTLAFCSSTQAVRPRFAIAMSMLCVLALRWVTQLPRLPQDEIRLVMACSFRPPLKPHVSCLISHAMETDVVMLSISSYRSLCRIGCGTALASSQLTAVMGSVAMFSSELLLLHVRYVRSRRSITTLLTGIYFLGQICMGMSSYGGSLTTGQATRPGEGGPIQTPSKQKQKLT